MLRETPCSALTVTVSLGVEGRVSDLSDGSGPRSHAGVRRAAVADHGAGVPPGSENVGLAALELASWPRALELVGLAAQVGAGAVLGAEAIALRLLDAGEPAVLANSALVGTDRLMTRAARREAVERTVAIRVYATDLTLADELRLACEATRDSG